MGKPEHSQAVIYTRFSPRPDADESSSCERQREACVRYCQTMGYEFDLDTRYFEDREASGDDVTRPGLWAAIEATRGGVLVVRWRHRLARDVYLSEVIRRAVAKEQGRIEAAEESNNGASPDDVFIQQILAAFAERERKVIALRTQYAMKKYQQAMRVMGSRMPYGYKVDPHTPGMMIPDPDEQETLEVIMDLHKNGRTPSEIARDLFLIGRPPRAADSWTTKTVQRIIKRVEEWQRQPRRAASP